MSFFIFLFIIIFVVFLTPFKLALQRNGDGDVLVLLVAMAEQQLTFELGGNLDVIVRGNAMAVVASAHALNRVAEAIDDSLKKRAAEAERLKVQQRVLNQVIRRKQDEGINYDDETDANNKLRGAIQRINNSKTTLQSNMNMLRAFACGIELDSTCGLFGGVLAIVAILVHCMLRSLIFINFVY